MMMGDEVIDHVEIGFHHTVKHRDTAIFDLYRRLGICWAREGRKAVLGVLCGEFVEPQRPIVPVTIPAPAVGWAGHGTLRAGLSQIINETPGSQGSSWCSFGVRMQRSRTPGNAHARADPALNVFFNRKGHGLRYDQ